MASTPDTSFSGEENSKPRGRLAERRKGIATVSNLPSPSSDRTTSDNTDAVIDDAIDRAYKTIWAHFCGLPSATEVANPTFHLGSQEAYERLYDRLADHKGLLQHFEEKIRRDWCSSTGQLTLRLMASLLHDFFVHYLSRRIDDELDRVAFSTPALRPFRSKIVFGGSAAIQLRDKNAPTPYFEKSPDGQWHHSSSRYPPFILEVAYSQDGKNLDDKVIQYFETLDGSTCGMLGFDIEYAERPRRKEVGFSHTASVSLWSSERDEEGLRVDHVMNAVKFRDQNGQALPGELVLPFKSFLPFKERTKIPIDTDTDSYIRIPFTALCEFVDNAERRQRIADGSTSPSPEPALAPTLPRQKRVRWMAKGEVVRDVIVKRQRKDILVGRSISSGKSEESESQPPLGRTRSQTRAASQPRRSGRTRTRTESRPRSP